MKCTITPDLSLFHEVQDITREHFNHSINRANQFYIADMQIIKAENRGKPQDRSYKHRIFTNPVKILRFLNPTIWCDCCFRLTELPFCGNATFEPDVNISIRFKVRCYSQVVLAWNGLKFECNLTLIFPNAPPKFCMETTIEITFWL